MDEADELILKQFNNVDSESSVNVKLIWGVSTIDDSSAKMWDSDEFGHLVWDDSFTLAPQANQLRFIDICTSLRTNSLVKDQ